MKFEFDRFNGIIIDKDAIPMEDVFFREGLAALVNLANAEQKNIVWLTLPISKSHLIPIAVGLGFLFHNCSPKEVTLTYQRLEDTFVPFMPTHTLGAGALVINSKNELLLIKEHGMQGLKLPGGHIELGEPIEQAIVREVYEETGIQTAFKSISGIATKHPYQFGKSNIYFICKLDAITNEICIKDVEEIEQALWMPVEDYISDESNSPFNRQVIQSLRDSGGLSLVSIEENKGPHKKQEVFLSVD